VILPQERVRISPQVFDDASGAAYSSDVKVTTAVTLSEDLLAAIDERAHRQHQDRSEVIEAAVLAFIARPASESKSVSDLEIINRNADRLNLEAEDVLTYQVIP
jgi:hypothetical protein